MRKLLLLFLVLFCTVSTWAMQRSSEEALAIARSFFSESLSTRSAGEIQLAAVSGDLLKSASTRNLSDEPSFYVYNNGQSAYVIVSGDDRMKPVLGYSDTGAFVTENLPSNLKAWLEFYDASYAALAGGAQTIREPRLMTRATFPETVSPLLGDINWDQGTPYNIACPLVGTERSVTGCVATAMAMILKYYEYPVRGTGSHSYTTRSGIQCSFNYGNTTFRWDDMLPMYESGNYTAVQAAAVAELMYACGVAVEMEYSPSGSGAAAYMTAQAFIDYFGYNENLGYVNREFFTSEEWMNMIKTELSSGRPVLYNGASEDVGHEFVFDGYDAQDMVHVNWGWGGMNNGYFEVTSLNPSSPGIGGGTNLGGGFIYQQGMVIGLQPSSASMNYVSHFQVEKLEIDKLQMTKGETFQLTVTNIFNMSTLCKNPTLAFIADKDGTQVEVSTLSLPSVEAYRGWSRLPMSGAIPTTLQDGTYALYLATKDERETSWSRVRGVPGDETQFTLVISGNQCTLTPFTGSLQVDRIDGTVESLHNLYSGRKGDFRVLLSNNNTDSEFYGLAGVLFVTRDVNEDVLAFTGSTQVLLPSNSIDKELLLSGDLIANLQQTAADLPAGDYYICPGIVWGDYVYGAGELTEVTVARAFGSPNLVVENIRLEKQQLHVGENLKILADLSLSGTGNVYNARLMAAIFAQGQGSTSNLHYAEVFVERDNAVSLVMDINPTVNEGRYSVNLYKPDLMGNYTGGPLASLSFTVVETPTGIEDESADVEGIVIYGQPVEDVLRIRASAEASSVSVYNLSGQMVLQERLSDTAVSEYSVSVDRLVAGYYIVALQTVDGKIYRSKFIKK